MTEPKGTGRPRGGAYPHIRSLRFSDRDAGRLKRLAEKMELAESDVIRIAIREKAEREGVE